MGKTRIDPEAWYTLSEMVKHNFLPFCGTDIRRYRSAVKADLNDRNILKAIVRGTGMGIRYSFKGSNIIRFLTEVEAGKVKL